MAEFVAILEDDPTRIAAMRACLGDVLPSMQAVFFEDAQQMIAWLGEHLGQVVLISLDHDLPMRKEAGDTVDCGTGRQVVDYLASMPPTCPVIVHSSNANCAPGMFYALKDAGWPCSRVYPSADQIWIREVWAAQMAEMLFVYYPEVRAYRDLGEFLQAELNRRNVHAAIQSIDPTCWAEAKSDRRCGQIIMATQQRQFVADFGERGVMLVHLSTASSESLVEALALWLGQQLSPTRLAERLPMVEVSETAAAYEAGPEELVRHQWDWLLKPVEEPVPTGWHDLAALVRTAMRRAELRYLFPHTSHGTLCFSRCTGYPYSRDCPVVTPLSNGRYRVEDMAGRALGEGSAEEAVALLVQHLPPHCGPAIHGTADDLPSGMGSSNPEKQDHEHA